jgi:hypothetical protein
MTDELKHPADGPEQEITSEPAGFAPEVAEDTKQVVGGVPESRHSGATRIQTTKSWRIEGSNVGR